MNPPALMDQPKHPTGTDAASDEDAWFWTPEWQRGHAEALDDLAKGRVTEYDDPDDFIRYLRSA